MGMGTRQAQEKQEEIWIENVALARSPGHPFYQRLNELLDGEKFDEFVEGLCGKFNAPRFGRPSLAPGIYFRSLLIGYFEGIDSERGIAWRLADSLALRQFVRIGITEQSPDHSTISRTRRLIDVETHRAVFGWVLGLLADRGLIQGKREGVNATTLEAHGSDCRLAIVGTGTPELLEQIREQVKSLGLKRVQLQLRFISARELVALYRAADVVVYPYRAITTSGALATGLALGKTIVASDLPVFRELLTDRENALLVDPEDSVKFADALIELAQDAGLRERLASRVRAMDFGEQSWISIAKRTVQAYESALLSSPHPSFPPSPSGI